MRSNKYYEKKIAIRVRETLDITHRMHNHKQEKYERENWNNNEFADSPEKIE